MNTVLFDLDGTLLPMDQEEFVERYFRELVVKSQALPPELHLDGNALIKAVWAGTKAMVENDGLASNEDRFWSIFTDQTGVDKIRLEPFFKQFYLNEFNRVKAVTAPTPHASACVRILKEKGYRLALATNPIFPREATWARIGWAGLDPSDFDLITTYENSSFSKPNPEYYRGILTHLGKRAEDCLMIGNDVREDMCAATLGMECFLLTDCLLQREEDEKSLIRNGNFDCLIEYAQSLPDAANHG